MNSMKIIETNPIEASIDENVLTIEIGSTREKPARKKIDPQKHALYMRRYRAKKTEAYVECQKKCVEKYSHSEKGKETINRLAREAYQKKKEKVQKEKEEKNVQTV